MTDWNRKPIFDAVRAVIGPFSAEEVKALDLVIDQAQRLNDARAVFDFARAHDDDAEGLSQIEVDLIDRGLAAARGGFAAMPRIGQRAIGAKGKAIIKRHEGLELRAYKCPADVWTIGYGSTGPHVHAGQVITEAVADDLLEADLDRFEEAVERSAPGAPQEMFDAMVSLAFNIGIGAFQRSTVLRRHLAGDHAGAADAFAMWNRARRRVMPGLVKRRADEAALYREGIGK